MVFGVCVCGQVVVEGGEENDVGEGGEEGGREGGRMPAQQKYVKGRRKNMIADRYPTMLLCPALGGGPVRLTNFVEANQSYCEWEFGIDNGFSLSVPLN